MVPWRSIMERGGSEARYISDSELRETSKSMGERLVTMITLLYCMVVILKRHPSVVVLTCTVWLN